MFNFPVLKYMSLCETFVCHLALILSCRGVIARVLGIGMFICISFAFCVFLLLFASVCRFCFQYLVLSFKILLSKDFSKQYLNNSNLNNFLKNLNSFVFKISFNI